MTEADDALKWARERSADVSDELGLTQIAAATRCGLNDKNWQVEQYAEAYRAGQSAAASEVATLREENARFRRVLLPMQMALAEIELADGPVPDDCVLLHHSGSGASDSVTAGMLRAALGEPS